MDKRPSPKTVVRVPLQIRSSAIAAIQSKTWLKTHIEIARTCLRPGLLVVAGFRRDRPMVYRNDQTRRTNGAARAVFFTYLSTCAHVTRERGTGSRKQVLDRFAVGL